MRTIHQIAKGLSAILGSQEAVAEVLGVGQPNVHAYLKDAGASASRPVVVLGDKIMTEANVRLDWVLAFMVARHTRADLELVRVEEIVSGGGRALLDREIEVFQCGAEGDWPSVATEAAKEIVSKYLAWAFATWPGRFAFYRRDGEELFVVTFTVRGDLAGVSATMPGDPIFGG